MTNDERLDAWNDGALDALRHKPRATNTPTFGDFIAEKVGTRDWYTSRRPAPVRSRGFTYIKPSVFNAIAAEYEALFGVNPRLDA